HHLTLIVLAVQGTRQVHHAIDLLPIARLFDRPARRRVVAHDEHHERHGHADEGDEQGALDDDGVHRFGAGGVGSGTPLLSSKPALPTSCAASTVWITPVMLLVVASGALSPPLEIVTSFACDSASA